MTDKGGCIFFRSTVQARTGQSSMDAELMAVYDVMSYLQRAHWIIQQCRGEQGSGGPAVEHDNQSLVQFMNTRVMQPVSTVHLTRKFKCVFEAIKHKELSLYYVDGRRILANGLTKVLTGREFTESRTQLLGEGLC